MPIEGEFSFTGREVEEDEVRNETTMPAISLLMESVRLQDELPLYKEKLSDPERVFRQRAAHLSWEDSDTNELAAEVWSRLKRGASLNDLQRDVPRSSYAIYRRLALVDSGQIEGLNPVASRMISAGDARVGAPPPAGRVSTVMRWRWRERPVESLSVAPLSRAMMTISITSPLPIGSPRTPTW
jgi:hypothetical protein